MPKRPTITEDQKDQVVKLYREGRKWREIAAEVGIQQPNIGWILEERGERKTRQRPPSEQITTSQAMERAIAAERSAAEWQVRYEQEHLSNERLMGELIQLREETGTHTTRALRVHDGEAEADRIARRVVEDLRHGGPDEATEERQPWDAEAERQRAAQQVRNPTAKKS